LEQRHRINSKPNWVYFSRVGMIHRWKTTVWNHKISISSIHEKFFAQKRY
jgi:hypothetical protein